jgi:non-heme chloroperoxidase
VASTQGLIEAAGITFACREAGEGPPLLFIHGSLGSLGDFAAQVDFFSSRFRAVSYSRRYHPPNASDDPGAPYTLVGQADDIAAVIHAAGMTHPDVIASSWGGYAALLCAIRHPGTFRSLVLGEPPMLPLLEATEEGRAELEKFQSTALSPSRDAFLRGDQAEGVARFFDGIAGRSGAFNALSPAVRAKLLEAGPELRLEFLSPFAEYMPSLAEDDLRSIRIPVLLLNGERSPRFFGIITDRLEGLLPVTRRRKIPLSGHSMQIANPRVYNAVVEEFLHSVQAGSLASTVNL